MTEQSEEEIRAALRLAADHLVPPPADLAAIRRGGRRRRVLTIGAGVVLPVMLAAGVVAGGTMARRTPQGTGSGNTRPTASSTGRPAAHQRSAAAAVSRVRAFYARYQAAESRGRRAVDALIGSRVASWYAPVLEARAGGGPGPPGCGAPPLSSGVWFAAAGQAGGQEAVVARWTSQAGQRSSIIAVILPRTGKITGITCTTGTGNVSATGAANAASSLYQPYLQARKNGTPPTAEIVRLTSTGPASGSRYLRQALAASASRPLSYDPVLCASKPPATVTIGTVRIIAGGSAGLVAITPRDRPPVLAVVVLSAKGWTVADIACQNP